MVDWKFDLQLFAGTITGGLSTDDTLYLSDLEVTGVEANGNVLYIEDDVLKYGNSTEAGTNTKIATYGTNTGWTLESTVTTIIKNDSTKNHKITGGTDDAITVSSSGEDNENTFTVTGTQTAAITLLGSGFGVLQLDSTNNAMNVTEGSAVVQLLNNTDAATVLNKMDDTNNATIAVTGNTGDVITFTAGSGISAVSLATGNTSFDVDTDKAIEVLGDTLKGEATVAASNETFILADGAVYTTKAAKTVGFAADTTTGITVNGVTLDTDDAGSDFEVKTAASTTGTGDITEINFEGAGGDITITYEDKFTSPKTIKVIDTDFTLAAGQNGAQFALSQEGIGVTGGKIVLSAGNYVRGNADSVTAGTQYTEVVTLSGTGSVNVTFGGGAADAAGLAAGQTLTIQTADKSGTKYTASAGANNTILVQQETLNTDGDVTGDPTYFTVTSAATGYDINGLEANGTSIKAASVGKITVAGLTGDHYYNTYGVELASSSGAAATVRGGTTAAASKSVEVSSKIVASVELTGATATVTDKGTETVYTVADNSSIIAKNVTFTSTDGVVSNANGTVEVAVAGQSLKVSGGVSVDASINEEGGIITYVAGNDVRNAKVTLYGENKYVVLNEANGSSATDTEISYNGNITGLDGDAEITTKNLNTKKTITTVGSGTFTINKVAYVVAEDEDGVVFTIDANGDGTSTAMNDTIDKITGLAAGGTVTVSSKTTLDKLTINGTDFENLTARSGFVATGLATNETGTLTLLAANDTVEVDNLYYTVNSMGSASDGIVVGTNTLSALNDGDKITVTNSLTSPTRTVVYEAIDGKLNVSTTADGTTTSKVWTLTDATDTGFDVSSASAGTVSNGEAGESVAALTLGNSNNPAANVNSLVDGMYVTSDGKVSLSNTKAVAQISLANDTVTYTTTAEKAQTVKVTGDTDSKENWSINTLGGKDEIEVGSSTGSNVVADVSVSSGAGNDIITIGSKSSGDLTVNAGDGKDTITLTNTGDSTVNAGAGNDTIKATGSGDYVINLDSGNNKVDRVGATKGNATITGGSGNDTIAARNGDDVVVGTGGNNTYDVTGSSITVNDYHYGSDVFQVSSNSGAFAVSASNFAGDGVVTVGNFKADVSAGTGTGEYYAVSLVDKDGKNKQNVAWAKEGGSTIDITTYDQAVTLIGDADGKNALYAGTKADTIYSYADSDSVYGGAGKDSISLAANGSGRVVGVATTSSKDTVSGFTASFEDGDSIYMVDGSASDVKASFANNTVTFKDGEGSLQLNNVATSSTGAVELNVHGTKMALTGTNGVIATDSTSYADFYVGDNAAVSFATAEGEVNVDLRNGLDSGAEGAKFSGIIAVTGGAGNNTLIGSTGADSIYAGTGASDAFFIGAGDGSDVVMNFSAAGNENADTVYALNDITGAKLTSNGVEISVGDTDKLTLKNVTADTAIKFNSNGNAGVAKVGSTTNANNFSYDSTVTSTTAATRATRSRLPAAAPRMPRSGWMAAMARHTPASTWWMARTPAATSLWRATAPASPSSAVRATPPSGAAQAA